MGVNRRLFEKKEGHCDYCDKRFDKYQTINRHSVAGLIVCRACYENHSHHGSFIRKPRRNLFEEKEGYCDYCKDKLNGKRNKYNDLVVCKRCKTRVQKNGCIEKKTFLCREEAKKVYAAREAFKKGIEKERSVYLKSLSPSQLLSEVGYE